MKERRYVSKHVSFNIGVNHRSDCAGRQLAEDILLLRSVSKQTIHYVIYLQVVSFYILIVFFSLKQIYRNIYENKKKIFLKYINNMKLIFDLIVLKIVL